MPKFNFKILLSLPRTIWFNFRHLPLKQAIKLPVWITNSTIVKGGGEIYIVSKPTLAMIRIGFHKVSVCEPHAKTVLNISPHGKLVFKGTAHIGNGTKIYVADGAELVLGDNFAVSASSQINCYKRIVFGRDIQFSWDCLVMDSDTHAIYNVNDEIINAPAEVLFGDKVWIGCRATILKGTIVPDNCVIGACSLVSGTKFEQNTIIVGNPAKSKRPIKGWHL